MFLALSLLVMLLNNQMASAQVSVRIGGGRHHVPRRAYYAPRPVYYAPRPAVVYAVPASRPVVVVPAPYYAPRPVYYAPRPTYGYRGHGHGRRR